MGYPGPTASLPGTARRSGRAGTVWDAFGNMLGEVVAIEWDVEVEQIGVSIPGTWQDENKPGAEGRRGTFRFQDVDDRWARRVWAFLRARKRGDRATAAQFPVFDLITQIDDVGAPAPTRWALRDCNLFQYGKGHSQDDNLLLRDVPFSFRDDEPLDSYEYTAGGVQLYHSN
jgi:hypothetical protein